MAETLVLAELSIDASGVVSGLAVVDPAMARVEKRTEQVGQQAQKTSGFLGSLTSRMFSLRSAAVALLGGFTLAGVILKMVDLLKVTVQNSETWKEWGPVVSRVFNSIMGGAEEAVVRLTVLQQNLLKLSQGTGITPVLTIDSQLQPLLALRKELAGIVDTFRLVNQSAPFDTRARASLNLAITDLNNVDAAILKILGSTKLTGAEIEARFGIQIPQAIQKAVPVFEKLGLESETAIQTFEDWGTLFVGFENSFTDMGESIREWDLDPVLDQFDELTVRQEQMLVLWQASGEAMLQMFETGKGGMRAFLQSVLRDLARYYLVKSIEELAEGFAALGRYDPVSATAHFQSAAKWFLAAAAAGAAAGAIGKGSSGGGGRAGAAPPPQEQSQPQRQIQVLFPNGIVFGTNENEIGPQLLTYIREAERRNG